jgi:predicted membrane protein
MCNTLIFFILVYVFVCIIKYASIYMMTTMIKKEETRIIVTRIEECNCGWLHDKYSNLLINASLKTSPHKKYRKLK